MALPELILASSSTANAANGVTMTVILDELVPPAPVAVIDTTKLPDVE